TDVVAGLIEHQHNALGRPGAYRAREVGERDAHHVGVRPRAQLPLAAPGGWMDEGQEVEPLEAVLHPGNRARSAACPDLLEDGLEPDPLLVGRPDFDARGRVALAHLRHLLAQRVFWQASWACTSALACRGRGR